MWLCGCVTVWLCVCQVFLLTDGEVNNTDAVVALCGRCHQDTRARVFTFGIGGEVSHALINGAAKAGGGQAETVVSGESMEPKVIRQLNRAMQPLFVNTRVDWGALTPHLLYPR